MNLREKVDMLEGANVRINGDLDRAHAREEALLQVLGELVEAFRCCERESQASKPQLLDGECGCVFAWDDSPPPNLCPSCRLEAAEVAAGEVLAQAELDAREFEQLRAMCPLARARRPEVRRG